MPLEGGWPYHHSAAIHPHAVSEGVREGVNGRKRHLLVERLVLKVVVHSAALHDRLGAKLLLGALGTAFPKLEHGLNHPSKLLLHALQRELALEPADVMLLAAFEQMVEYHCASLEADPDQA